MQTLAAGCLLFLSGCEVVQSARNDLNRLVSSDPFKTPKQTAARPTAPATSRPSTSNQAAATSAPAASTSSTNTSTASATSGPDVKTDPAKDPSSDQASINLIGKSEGEVKALFGPPTTVEERAPGKTWRYRDGKCSLDVQLYPDVQTRQFATLAYEVKNDDSTDEGSRACLGQLRSRGQSR